MKFRPIKFQKPSQADFYATVRERVNQYFQDNNKSTKGDMRMYLKTAALIAMFLVSFTFVVVGVQPYWLYLLVWIATGVSVAGIGFCVMHDANHDAYSNNPKFNRILSVIMSAVGGYDLNWRIQHNILHHSYTNVDGHDEDILAQPLLRFSPNQPLLKRHRFQFIYGWFFYSLMTLFWVTYKDFAQLVRYDKMKLLSSQKTTLKKALVRLSVHKVLYYAVMIVLPIIFAPFAWWMVLLGFIIMHGVVGMILSMVFQPAHVMPEKEFPLSNPSLQMSHGWAEHQLLTTANFAPKSRILTWYMGGLNYQIEHHLFPGICHVHYPSISAIVKQTAEEFQLPYHVKRTFAGALWGHTMMLKKLGTMPQVVASS